MKKFSFLFFVLIVLSISNLKAQNPRFGIEYNYYPAGHMIGIQSEWINKNHSAFNARIAANIARRKDFSGLNDDERGWGPGLSIGYRYYKKALCTQGWFAGLRTDLWNLSIDWKDSTQKPNYGNTKILVLQPTIEIGYNLYVNNGWIFSLSMANGREINIKTKGDAVGQGWITLGQLRIIRYINQ
ncbi:MAG: hypothetical protein GC181_08265 [Bacteroidetes bacterium]|nr:hypothetical protein [Bacteroidota bacterium]